MWEYIKRLLSREPSVANLVAGLEAQRSQMAAAAEKLGQLSKQKAEEAEKLAAKAKHQSDEAAWAKRIADKFADFIS